MSTDDLKRQIRPADLEQVAMFPLPSVVLLPGALLPLHIFEPRYREMIQAVLAGNQLLCMAGLRPGYEAQYHNAPPVYDTVGIGRIIASDKRDDGRYNVLLQGLSRACIEYEHKSQRSYRTVRARLLHDCQPECGTLELKASHERLVGLCERLALDLNEGGQALVQLVHSVEEPGACADLVAGTLLRDPDDKQELMEQLDPGIRVDQVIHLLVQLIADAGAGTSSLN